MTHENLWDRICAAWAGTTVTATSRESGATNDFQPATELLGAVPDTSCLLFIGNGGSQAIAAHAATDYQRHLGVHCDTPSSIAYMTAATNDFGYSDAFASWVTSAARPGAVLVAVSSSGQSDNIIRSIESAKSVGAGVLTLSGFLPNNPLRELGDVNVYVPSDKYQVVEAVHHIWLCQLLERLCGYAI